LKVIHEPFTALIESTDPNLKALPILT